MRPRILIIPIIGVVAVRALRYGRAMVTVIGWAMTGAAVSQANMGKFSIIPITGIVTG